MVPWPENGVKGVLIDLKSPLILTVLQELQGLNITVFMMPEKYRMNTIDFQGRIGPPNQG